MATTSRQADTSGNPQTSCENCRTVFEVTPELLSSTDTRVRCGECLVIFDALANLRADDPQDGGDTANKTTSADLLQGVVELDADASLDSDSAAAQERALVDDIAVQEATLAGQSSGTGTLDVTYSDFDLFSEEADLPEVAYFDQTHDTPEFDFDAVEIDGDETFSDTLFAHDITVDASVLQSPALSEVALLDSAEVDFVVDETQTDELVFNYDDRAKIRQPANSHTDKSDSEHSQDSDEDASHTVGSSLVGDTSDTLTAGEHTAGELVLPGERLAPWVFRVAMGLLLLILTATLVAYRSRDSLSENPLTRPVMQAACRIFDCVVPERIDLDSLKMLKRNTYSHPTVANALVIELAFVNNAEFAQPYPVLEVRMTSNSGRLVAKRNFTPVDYLPGWLPADTMASGKRLDISLEVKDPGERADSFLINFRKLPATPLSR